MKERQPDLPGVDVPTQWATEDEFKACIEKCRQILREAK